MNELIVEKADRKGNFLTYIRLVQEAMEREAALSKHNLCLGDFLDDYYGMASAIMMLAFTKEQKDTIEWWLYEDVEKVIWHTKPRKTTYRLETPEKLWDYLVKQCGVKP